MLQIVLCTYVCTPTFIATIANMGQFIGIFIQCKDRLPEDMCCCLQTDMVMCLPAFIVTSAYKASYGYIYTIA